MCLCERAHTGGVGASILKFKVKELIALGHTLFQETVLVCDSLETVFASCSECRKAREADLSRTSSRKRTRVGFPNPGISP